MRLYAVALLGGFLIAAAITTPASAQGLFDKGAEGLLDQGKSLLGNFGSSDSKSSSAGLSTGEIGRGLKEALRVGTERVVGTLGRRNGFYGTKDAHIPLPGTLGKVQKTLTKFGMGSLTEDLETRLNRAAEAAVPRTQKLFHNAIQAMTIDDVKKIYSGPQDSATQYFKGKMSKPLADSMKPVVDQELASAGAVQAYDRMMGEYQKLPFMPDAKADLTDYVLGKAMDGIFLYLGREEAAIRQNPAKRTTELLRKVFGQG